MKREDKAIEVLCEAVKKGRFLSCAHMAQAVRESMEEHDVGLVLWKKIEDELGMRLSRPSPEEEARLVSEGLLHRVSKPCD